MLNNDLLSRLNNEGQKKSLISIDVTLIKIKLTMSGILNSAINLVSCQKQYQPVQCSQGSGIHPQVGRGGGVGGGSGWGIFINSAHYRQMEGILRGN